MYLINLADISLYTYINCIHLIKESIITSFDNSDKESNNTFLN